MIEVAGTYNTAKLFTDTADNATIAQVTNLMNQPSAAGAKVRIMPDCHAGTGCVIGTTMTGVYTTSVNKGTLDESPMAYKPMEEIVRNIEPTAEIVSHIRPIYNFKAGDEELFKQIGIAFYVLSDPQSREEYDRQMHFREEIKAPTGLLNLQQNMRESPQSLRSRHQRAQ